MGGNQNALLPEVFCKTAVNAPGNLGIIGELQTENHTLTRHALPGQAIDDLSESLTQWP